MENIDLLELDKDEKQLIQARMNSYIQAVNHIENNFKKYVMEHVNNRHWLLNKELIQQDAQKFSFSPEGYDQLVRMRVIGEDFEQRYSNKKPNQFNIIESYWERDNSLLRPNKQANNQKLNYFDQTYHLIFHEKYQQTYRLADEMTDFWQNINASTAKKKIYKNGFTLYLFDQNSFKNKDNVVINEIDKQFGILLDQDNNIYSPYFNTGTFNALTKELESSGKPKFFDYENITYVNQTVKHIHKIWMQLLFWLLITTTIIILSICHLINNTILLSAAFILPIALIGLLTSFVLTDPKTNRIAFVNYDENKETIHEYRKKQTTSSH